MNDALHNKVVKFFYDHEELFIAIMNKTPYQSDGWDYEIEVVKEFLTANQSCYCGDIYNLGVIHRDDGPCHYPNDKEPEQEPNKDGSPCPEFWDWLPKAYNFEGDGNFTKYNMEVAFLAGKQSAQPEQEPFGFMFSNRFNVITKSQEQCELVTIWRKGGEKLIPLYTTPPQRKD